MYEMSMCTSSPRYCSPSQDVAFSVCFLRLRSSILDETAMLEMQGRMAIFLQQHELGRASYKRLIESNKDNECYILGLMACDEDERIRSLFALPCCSLNGAIGRADSMDFVKNLWACTESFSVSAADRKVRGSSSSRTSLLAPCASYF